MPAPSAAPSRSALGVDGCRGGWVVAERPAHRGAPVELRLARSFAEVLERADATIALDMPVGLPDGPRVAHRDCDGEARALLGSRRSTVFAPPLRSHLGARTYGARLRGAGLSIQAFHLLPKLREVDGAIAGADQDRVFEAHPELAFQRLAGEPLAEPKRTRPGRERRRALLAAARQPKLPGVIDALDRFLGQTRRSEVAEDDALDALVLTRTAWLRERGRARCLPLEPPRDARGLRMEIWW